jgi:hypothetical protein
MKVYRKSKLFYYLFAACSLAFSSVTHAQANEYTYLFKESLGHVDSSSYKSASYSQLGASDSGVWVFALRGDNSLFSSFRDGPFIGSMNFDVASVPELQATDHYNKLGGIASVSGAGKTGQNGLSVVDFSTQAGQGNLDSILDNDWVMWSSAELYQNGSLTSKYLHLPGIDASYYAKSEPVIAYPVPEPEAYAMLLAGLALIGFTARRRKESYIN